ncbi:hypothetical protein JTE90_024517 [Oedothorax gibbosus]|uniref:Uncharacterized protein n=1 Tax=Oedothorax gibbosus TaxID=931172 RepID=A0AAV6TVI3_9ARAC|nr:hypothetical protein JTE90_024517 [Oedothorax gibbosus]
MFSVADATPSTQHHNSIQKSSKESHFTIRRGEYNRCAPIRAWKHLSKVKTGVEKSEPWIRKSSNVGEKRADATSGSPITRRDTSLDSSSNSDDLTDRSSSQSTSCLLLALVTPTRVADLINLTF